jgi:hypothetical protein
MRCHHFPTSFLLTSFLALRLHLPTPEHSLANYDATVANYSQTTLVAFQEVEDKEGGQSGGCHRAKWGPGDPDHMVYRSRIEIVLKKLGLGRV